MNFDKNTLSPRHLEKQVNRLFSVDVNSNEIDINKTSSNKNESSSNLENNSNFDINYNKKWPSEINFANTYLNNLFVTEVPNPKKSQSTPKANYCLVHPTPLKDVHIISLSKPCAESLELNYPKEYFNFLISSANQTKTSSSSTLQSEFSLGESEDSKNKREEFEKFFSGSLVLSNSKPASHCYVGHQFGVFAGQLGDGRAISLGDFYTSKNLLYEIQLKGSGLTPYSRFADGRAVLRSSIREFLASEHLFSLGIPTTRALSIVGSSSEVLRDILYNGNAKNEKCAVVTRIAPSFMRFGSFEIFKDSDRYSGHSGPSVGLEKEMLPKMLEYVLKFHYKEVDEFYCKRDGIKDQALENASEKKKFDLERYKKLFELICQRTALLAAYWQSYGFTHGVLNTDNMSVLGVTIDYGPYGFMEFYDKSYTPNHSDKYGRYCYSQQPDICKWNLRKLAEGLDYCLPKEIGFQIIESIYTKKYEEFYNRIKANKLGLFLSETTNSDNIKLIEETNSLLRDYGIDLTFFFRKLADINKILISEIDNLTFDSVENLKSQLFNDEKIQFMFAELIEEIEAYSLIFQLRNQNNRLTLNPKALENLEKFINEDPEILFSFGLDPEMVKQQLTKKKENEEFSKKFPTRNSYEIQKTESLLAYFKKFIQNTLEEYNVLISHLDNLTNQKLSEHEKSNDFINNSSLSEDCFKNLIKSTRVDFFEQVENLAKKINGAETINKAILQEFLSIRFSSMNKLNPKFILRNYMAQEVIEKSEKGNHADLNSLLEVLMTPFDAHDDLNFDKNYSPNVEKAYNICISCSS